MTSASDITARQQVVPGEGVLTYNVGQRVTLAFEEDSIIPEGDHTISKINDNGSFHVGGNTAVWPHRIKTLH